MERQQQKQRSPQRTTACRWARPIVFTLVVACGSHISAAQELSKEAETGLRKAVAYYRTRVAYRGGYVYHYSEDLAQRWGEGVATPTQIWVQPPGTPTVGMAFVKAYEATGDRFYLDAADEAAQALMFGQLQSGCWAHAIDFDPKGRRSGQYRNGKGRGKNYSTLDDDVSQAALRLLMSVDRAHRFEHNSIHEATQFGLKALLNAQFPNGGFPQVWSAAVKQFPVLKASYPEYDWRTENRIKEYWRLNTLNDNLAGDVAETLALAHEVYGDDRYRAALTRLGDFLILAQMPEPQPAWCQQYTFDMKPAWARKFEPPAITSSESQDVMRTLMLIYDATNDRKYLEPIPRALAYFKNSLLTDGRLPRFFELRSNKPLYMKRNGKVYTLTYDDSNLPSHYAFKITPKLDRIREEYGRLTSPDRRAPAPRTAKSLEGKVRRILDALDDRGRWVTTYEDGRHSGQPGFKPGFRFLSSAEFARNVETLSAYLMALDERVR